MKFNKTDHKILVCCRGLFREADIYQLNHDFYFRHGKEENYAKISRSHVTSAENVEWVFIEAAPGWKLVEEGIKVGFERL